MTRMEKIVRALQLARDEYDYGYVEVTIPGQDGTEIIVNRKQSLDNKIAFYQRAYDENGVHCMNSAVRIVGAGALGNMLRIRLMSTEDE